MNKRALRGIIKYLKPYTGYLVITVLCALVTVAVNLAVPYLVGLSIDCIVGVNEVNYERLAVLLTTIGVSVLTYAVVQWGMTLCNQKVAFEVLADIRRDAFSKLFRLPLSYLDNKPNGETVSVLISDAESFSDGLLLGFTQLFTGLLTIVGTLVVMIVMRWQIALVVFLITPVSLFTARFIANKTYSMFKRQSESRAEQTAFIDEAIGNVKVVKAYLHEEENEQKFDALNEDLRKVSLRAIFFSSTTNPTTRFINNVVYAVVALVGAFSVITTGGAFTVGNLSTFLSYSNQYTKPFNEISEVIAEFQNALACASRLLDLIEAEEESSDEGKAELVAPEGRVELKGVAFSYSPEKKFIEGMDITAEGGKRIAIVGHTGCGKTTIINLLMRFYDVDEGSIEVDGVDVRNCTRHSLRKNFGMVLQDTWLKKATVRENLKMGNPDCTEEEMISAAKSAHAHSFIMRLPNGYDTVIGDEGGLSQGQKQLLCIARVMLSLPPMLILDEATSSIDTRTELKVQDAFARMMKGRTSFVVAHRLSTIKNADLILVMDDGKIVERGTHEELLQRGGAYAELYGAQFEGVE